MTKTHAIKTAAKWWAETLKLKQPHSNGDNSVGSMVACTLTDTLAEDVTDKQLALFTKELEVEIHKFMEKYGDNHTCLGCDYDPDEMLFAAAKKARISKFNFPYKTYMRIKRSGDNYTVEVAAGYGVGYEKVMPCKLSEEKLLNGLSVEELIYVFTVRYEGELLLRAQTEDYSGRELQIVARSADGKRSRHFMLAHESTPTGYEVDVFRKALKAAITDVVFPKEGE